MRSARMIFLLLAALFLVPWAGAATQVVNARGALVTVAVVRTVRGAGPTALTYSVLQPDGTLTSGWVGKTRDRLADREPSLVLGPGLDQPALVWSRHDGQYNQVAFSRFDGKSWTETRYLTTGGVDHLHPQAGVDGSGTGYAIWMEPIGGGRLMMAVFDPSTGTLYSSPRDILLELARHSPPEWLRPEQTSLGDGDEGGSGGGGNDGPAVPADGHKLSQPAGNLTLNSGCTRVAVAVAKRRSLFIGILEGGVVLKYYRSMVPVGAPDNYASLLLESLLNQNCR